MKKETHEGKQYTIGGLYEFSDNEEDWVTGELGEIRKIREGYTLTSFVNYRDEAWVYIREIQNPIIGTIEDAPIELEDGCTYQFTLCDFICYGRYVKKVNKFDMVHPSEDAMIAINECADIVKLVPEVK